MTVNDDGRRLVTAVLCDITPYHASAEKNRPIIGLRCNGRRQSPASTPYKARLRFFGKASRSSTDDERILFDFPYSLSYGPAGLFVSDCLRHVIRWGRKRVLGTRVNHYLNFPKFSNSPNQQGIQRRTGGRVCGEGGRFGLSRWLVTDGEVLPPSRPCPDPIPDPILTKTPKAILTGMFLAVSKGPGGELVRGGFV
eukprot:1361781-Amorphochlora_amoeboformis.AAC.2